MSFDCLANIIKTKNSKTVAKRTVSFLEEKKETNPNIINIQKLDKQSSIQSDGENESSESRSYGSHSNFTR